MSDPNEDFAANAVAALGADKSKDAPSDEGGHESAEADPIAEYAKTLQALGVTPETARDFNQKIAYMQTPQGQQEWHEGFLKTEQGARLREQFGREHLANLLATPGGAEKVLALSREFGAQMPEQRSADLDDLTEEQRETRAVKAQLAALENRLKQIDAGAGSKIQELETKLRGRDEAEGKLQAFQAWAGSQPPMPTKAYGVIAKRAHELAMLYPDKYAGPRGFQRAAGDAHGEYSSNAQLFQPKPRPRGTSSGGGGVAGSKVDESKLSLEQRIALAADDFALHARGED